MKTQSSKQPTQQETRFRRVGFLIYPDCEILDVCGPFEAFYFADMMLGLLGRTKEPSYQSLVLAAAPGPIRTMSGMEITATHRYSDIADGLDTLIVVGGLGCEEASKDPCACRMGSFNGAEGAAGRINLLGRIHFGGRGSLASSARDDPLDVLRPPREGIPVDRSRCQPHLRSRREYLHVRRDHYRDRSRPSSSGGRSRPRSYARRLASLNCFSQASRRAIPVQGHTSPLEKPIRPNISELQAWMLAHPEAEFSVPALADRMAMSPRNFSRLFHSETGIDSGAVRRTGASRRGPLQTRTNSLAGRDDRRGMRVWQCRTHAAHISAPFRDQSSGLPGAVSIDLAHLT